MDAPALQEVTVQLPSDLVQYLQDEGVRRGTTAADVMQQAIVNDRFLRQQQNSGSNVLLEKDKNFSKLAL